VAVALQNLILPPHLDAIFGKRPYFLRTQHANGLKQPGGKITSRHTSMMTRAVF